MFSSLNPRKEASARHSMFSGSQSVMLSYCFWDENVEAWRICEMWGLIDVDICNIKHLTPLKT